VHCLNVDRWWCATLLRVLLDISRTCYTFLCLQISTSGSSSYIPKAWISWSSMIRSRLFEIHARLMLVMMCNFAKGFVWGLEHLLHLRLLPNQHWCLTALAISPNQESAGPTWSFKIRSRLLKYIHVSCYECIHR
jgi:hypothetical protein